MQIYDSAPSGETCLPGNPNTSLLPGREVTWKIGFGAKDPKDLILQIAMHPNQAPLLFKS